jgi:hypothetical protein
MRKITDQAHGYQREEHVKMVETLQEINLSLVRMNGKGGGP